MEISFRRGSVDLRDKESSTELKLKDWKHLIKADKKKSKSGKRRYFNLRNTSKSRNL